MGPDPFDERDKIGQEWIRQKMDMIADINSLEYRIRKLLDKIKKDLRTTTVEGVELPVTVYGEMVWLYREMLEHGLSVLEAKGIMEETIQGWKIDYIDLRESCRPKFNTITQQHFETWKITSGHPEATRRDMEEWLKQESHWYDTEWEDVEWRNDWAVTDDD